MEDIWIVIHGCMMDDPYVLVNLRLDDRKSIEHLSKIDRTSIEHLWIWGGSGVDLGCIWVGHSGVVLEPSWGVIGHTAGGAEGADKSSTDD